MPVEYLVTQYGQLYGLFDSAHAVKLWANAHISSHLWSEYRVHIMPLNVTYIPGVDSCKTLPEFMVD